MHPVCLIWFWRHGHGRNRGCSGVSELLSMVLLASHRYCCCLWVTIWVFVPANAFHGIGIYAWTCFWTFTCSMLIYPWTIWVCCCIYVCVLVYFSSKFYFYIYFGRNYILQFSSWCRKVHIIPKNGWSIILSCTHTSESRIRFHKISSVPFSSVSTN